MVTSAPMTDPVSVTQEVPLFTVSGGILDSGTGMIAVAPPAIGFEGETASATLARRDAKFGQIALALNAAAALLEKLEDNPTLFFGMEDTCYDEFDDLRTALGKLS